MPCEDASRDPGRSFDFLFNSPCNCIKASIVVSAASARDDVEAGCRFDKGNSKPHMFSNQLVHVNQVSFCAPVFHFNVHWRFDDHHAMTSNLGMPTLRGVY